MLGGSIYYKKQRDEEKEVDVAVAEKKAKDKQAAWIRELEIRDKEDQEVRRLSSHSPSTWCVNYSRRTATREE